MQSQSDVSPTAAPYQPSPIETEQPSLARSLPRDWSVWLLPVACVSLASAPVWCYALPTNFDPLVPLRVLVLLCVALLAFIWLRTRGLLSSASNNVVTYKRDGTPIIWNLTLPIGALFNIGLIYAGFGALEFWTTRLDSFDFSALRFLFTSIATWLCTLCAALLWLSRFPTLDNLLHKRLANRWVLIAHSSWLLWCRYFFGLACCHPPSTQRRSLLGPAQSTWSPAQQRKLTRMPSLNGLWRTKPLTLMFPIPPTETLQN